MVFLKSLLSRLKRHFDKPKRNFRKTNNLISNHLLLFGCFVQIAEFRTIDHGHDILEFQFQDLQIGRDLFPTVKLLQYYSYFTTKKGNKIRTLIRTET